MLAAYHNWVFENHRNRIECVEALREWVIQDTDFQCRALEMVQGLTVLKVGKAEARASGYKETQRTFLEGLTLDQNLSLKVRGHVEFVTSHMECGHVESLNRWMCPKGGN